jgi:acylpyruvate hydrolase
MDERRHHTVKLVTFEHKGQVRIGALQGDSVVDLNRAESRLPTDMISFLEAGDQALNLAKNVVASAPAKAVLNRSAVTLKAPIPRPGKILCLGLNYRDHAEETKSALPEYPIIFTKYANTVIGPGEAIMLPKVSQQIDYEAEFGVVIGRRARNVAQAKALDHVAGYVCFNDVSARDYQRKTSQWTIGKTFDTFGPMGPALVTADEIADPHNLDIRLILNGEVMQSSNTRHLIFTVDYLIAELSTIMTLEPGDVISTGTPGGVGMARNPQRWLRPGDVVQVEIEGLGVLENPVVAEA